VREGDILAGKYRVERVLGMGGMGVVVAAHHIQLQQKVALKFLLPEALGNPDAVERFLREARAAVQIKSEHVASVKDVGTLPNGAPYMVMEFLEGGDLAGWIKQRGALPIDQAAEFVIQACVAVAEAHGLRIVHRDLKPANLFCVRRADGQLSIKVLDFGISKMTDPTGTGAGASMTQTATVMGTPLYMSPEQMRSSKDVDGRTDIWALGAILFELIAGRPPFLAQTVMELGSKIGNEPPPPLRAFRPDAPKALEAVVFKCLEKDRTRRYRHVGELALAILPFAPKRAKGDVERISGIIESAGLAASALAVPASPRLETTLAAPGTLPPIGVTTVGATKGKSTALGLGLVGTALAAVGVTLAVYAWRGGTHVDAEGKNLSAGAGSLIPAVPSAPAKAPEAPPPVATSLPPAAPAVTSLAATTSPDSDSSPSPASPASTGGPRPGPQPAPVASAGTPPSSPAPDPPRPPAVVNHPPPDCSTPFTIDSRKHRVPKPECL
jgi:serine/threonine-protein kinase